MKKLIAILLAVFLTASFTGCENNADTNSDANKESTNETASESKQSENNENIDKIKQASEDSDQEEYIILGEDISEKIDQIEGDAYARKKIEEEFDDTLFFIDMIYDESLEEDGSNIIYATKDATRKLKKLEKKYGKKIYPDKDMKMKVVTLEGGYDFDRPIRKTTSPGSFSGGVACVTFEAFSNIRTNESIGLITFDELKEICKDSDGFVIFDKHHMPVYMYRFK